MVLMPRPVSPRNALADLKLMFARERPHRWGLLGVSGAITFILLWGFMLDSRPPPKEREIFYVESWMNDRKDSDIIRQQRKDLADYEAALADKQKEYQHVADMVGIEWRKDEAENRARRAVIIAGVEKRLAAQLAEALKREAARGKTGAASTDTATTATGSLGASKLIRGIPSADAKTP